MRSAGRTASRSLTRAFATTGSWRREVGWLPPRAPAGCCICPSGVPIQPPHCQHKSVQSHCIAAQSSPQQCFQRMMRYHYTHRYPGRGLPSMPMLPFRYQPSTFGGSFAPSENHSPSPSAHGATHQLQPPAIICAGNARLSPCTAGPAASDQKRRLHTHLARNGSRQCSGQSRRILRPVSAEPPEHMSYAERRRNMRLWRMRPCCTARRRRASLESADPLVRLATLAQCRTNLRAPLRMGPPGLSPHAC